MKSKKTAFLISAVMIISSVMPAAADETDLPAEISGYSVYEESATDSLMSGYPVYEGSDTDGFFDDDGSPDLLLDNENDQDFLTDEEGDLSLLPDIEDDPEYYLSGSSDQDDLLTDESDTELSITEESWDSEEYLEEIPPESGPAGSDELQEDTAHINEPGEDEEDNASDDQLTDEALTDDVLQAGAPGGKCGANLTWSLKDGVLTISGTGDMYDYEYDYWNTDAAAPWGRETFTKAVIKSGVSRIGKYAFRDCIYLSDVSIPGTVSSIGFGAFLGCNGLKKVTVPGNVKVLDNDVFGHCSNLTDVVFSEGVTDIGSFVFIECPALKNVTLPDSLKSIKNEAFCDCSSLTSLLIPAGVQSIGIDVFVGCSSLTSFSVSGKNNYFSSIDGVLFNKAMTKLISYPGGKAGAYSIPVGVIGIEYGAFSHCEGLTGLTIPVSVKSIGKYGFYTCTGLKDVTVPGSIGTINEYVFAGCSSLQQVTIGAGITKIEDNAFSECTGLSKIVFPGSAPGIEGHAFLNIRAVAIYDPSKNGWTKDVMQKYGAVRLIWKAKGEQVPDVNHMCGDNLFFTLKDGVLTISGTGEMWPCDGHFEYLMEAEYPSYQIDDWDGSYNLFQGYGEIKKIVFKSGVTAISYGAFYNCRNLTSVSIPETVTRIDAYAFYDCIKLKELTYSNSNLQSIGTCAFLSCSSLKKISFPKALKSINYSAFSGSGIEEVHYAGTRDEWEKVKIEAGNDPILQAGLYYSGWEKDIPLINGVFNSRNGADIRWKTVKGCSGYKVYRQRSAEGTKQVAGILPPQTTQCYDTGIRDNCWGRVYHYYVTPVFTIHGVKKEGPGSDKLPLQRLAPVNITKAEGSGRTLNVTWASSVKDNKADGYEVQYALSSADLYGRSGTYGAVQVDGRTRYSTSLKNLNKGRTYLVRVRCYVNYVHSVTGVKTKTWSQYSNVVSVKLKEETPVYQAVSSVQNSKDGIYVYWSVSKNAEGYNVYRKEGTSGTWIKLKYVAGRESRSYLDAEVINQNGKLYYYTVRGVIGTALSNYNKTGKPIVRLVTPGLSAPVNNASQSASLTWSRNGSANGYEIQYSTDADFKTNKSLTITSSTTGTTVIKSLARGKTCYFRVRSYKTVSGAAYYSHWSAVKSVKITK